MLVGVRPATSSQQDANRYFVSLIWHWSSFDGTGMHNIGGKKRIVWQVARGEDFNHILYSSQVIQLSRLFNVWARCVRVHVRIRVHAWACGLVHCLVSPLRVWQGCASFLNMENDKIILLSLCLRRWKRRNVFSLSVQRLHLAPNLKRI